MRGSQPPSRSLPKSTSAPRGRVAPLSLSSGATSASNKSANAGPPSRTSVARRPSPARTGTLPPLTASSKPVSRSSAPGAGVVSQRGALPPKDALQEEMDALADEYFAEEALPYRASQGGEQNSSSMYKTWGRPLGRMGPTRQWETGPRDTQGRLFDASDSNLLCMDVLASAPSSGSTLASRKAGGRAATWCVVGSADHGLKVFDAQTMRELKNLYTKTAGHTEWVTCCRFLSDGRVLSGGMDSKLCLWDCVGRGGPARCSDLLGHTASVSQVEVAEQRMGSSTTAISAGYDRTLRIWSLTGGGGGREVGRLTGHKAAVVQFSWAGTQLISGDRSGTAKLWDVETGSCLLTATTQRGAIGSMCHFTAPSAGEGRAALSVLTAFGDRGGGVTVLDARAPSRERSVYQEVLHPGGAVTALKATTSDSGDPSDGYLVTCGADKRMCVLDPRMSFQTVFEWEEHTDFIYSLHTYDHVVLSGAGNGWLLAHDVRTGECLYGLGANTAAVREIFTTSDYLIAAGDDGKAMVYDF